MAVRDALTDLSETGDIQVEIFLRPEKSALINLRLKLDTGSSESDQ